MKKTLTAILVIAAIALPVFAATDTELKVNTEVASVTEYGFYKGARYSGLETATLTGLVGETEQTLSSEGDTYSVVVRTNVNGGVKVELHSTKLILSGPDGGTVDFIPLKIDGTEYTSTSKKKALETTSGTGLRILQAPFVLSYDTDKFNSATVGTYHATVTMTVTGV